jgi:hypothetical protein
MMPHGAQDKVQKAKITIHNACLKNNERLKSDVSKECAFTLLYNNKIIKMVDITSDCEKATDDNNKKSIWGFRGSPF